MEGNLSSRKLRLSLIHIFKIVFRRLLYGTSVRALIGRGSIYLPYRKGFCALTRTASFSGEDGSVLATDTSGKQVTAPSVAISNDVKAEQVLADSLAKINHKVQMCIRDRSGR